MDQLLLDRLAIRQLIENWVVRRDAGDWDALPHGLALRTGA